MMFGPITPRVIRFLPAVAQGAAIVVTALIARRLGGNRAAQWIAAIATAISPPSLATSALYQYVAFDYLWWVVIAYCIVALIDSDDRRWWLAIGVAIGLAAMTKYTIAFFLGGLAFGFFATRMYGHMRSRWFWLGVVAACAIVLPHFAWEARHGWISLEFLKAIHTRDVRIGRTDHFLIEQLYVCANPVTILLWVRGLIALFTSPRLQRFRILGWIAVVTFVLFVLAHGRSYYAGPLYPMLFAAGATEFDHAVDRSPRRRWAYAITMVAFVIGLAVLPFALPLAPVGSRLFKIASKMNGDFVEELGWPELTREVARIWFSIPPAERAHTAIYCSNYGEAGAVDLYGPVLGLPQAISGINSYWERGYGSVPPQTVIVLGASKSGLEKRFDSVVVAGHTPNPYHVENEETSDHPDIFVCRGLRGTWQELWPQTRSFG